MLGRGCLFKGQCGYCSKANGFHRKNYCDSDTGWKDCPHRPVNHGDQKVQRKYNYHKASDSNTKTGQIVIVIIIIAVILSKFFL